MDRHSHEGHGPAPAPLLVGPHVLVDGLTRVPGGKTHPVSSDWSCKAHVCCRRVTGVTRRLLPLHLPEHLSSTARSVRSATRRRHRNRTRRGPDGRSSQPLRYREPRRRYEPDGPCDPELPCSEFPGVPAAFAACLAACASAFALRCARELVSPGLFGLILSSAS